MCEICSKLKIKAPEDNKDTLTVNFEHVSHLFAPSASIVNFKHVICQLGGYCRTR